MDSILSVILFVIFYSLMYQIYVYLKKIKFNLVNFITLNTVIIFVLCIFSYIIDVFKIPKFIYDRKIQKDTCMDQSFYHELFITASLKYFLWFVPFTILLFLIVEYRNKHLPGLSTLKITRVSFVILLWVSSLFSEFVSYFIHKSLHSTYLFHFHKHHHSYISPVSISTYDSHIVECFFWDLLPTFSFAILFGLPVPILYIAGTIGTISGILVHSGYRLADSGMLDNAHHDLHHERMKCNYSTPFVDSLMGTKIYREPGKIYPKFDKKEKDISESNNTMCE